MDNFVVSARKYRPTTFDSVVGQKVITNTLKNAIKNQQLAQAFLFCGPRGVGKTTCARILAKTINCLNVTANIEPCNECESCKSFNESHSFNIHELDAASNNSVDDIRSLVDQVRIPPQAAKYKVYIIDEVHMLSTAAFNAFLKTLEEPPEYAKFILATTEKHKIIPTILSRCQIFDFKRITIEDIIEHLAYVAKCENVIINTDALHVIAQKADGAMRDSLSIFDQMVSFAGKEINYNTVIQNLNVLDYDYYFAITNHLVNGNISESLLLLDEIIEKGFDGYHFNNGLGEHLRNLLVCKDPITLKLLETGANIKEKYKDQAQKCAIEFLIKAIEITNRVDNTYKSSYNKRLALELALMQMCSIMSMQNIQQQKAISQNIAINPPVNKVSETSNPVINQNISQQKAPAANPAINKEKDGTEIVNTQQLKNLNLGTTSINLSDEDDNEKKKSNGVKSPENNLQANAFTQEMLDECWQEYLQSLESENISLFATLKKNKALLGKDFTIKITLDNDTQQDEVEFKEGKLIGFLRQQLNNYKITIDFKVERNTVTEQKPYKPTEKYQHMVQMNPNLAKFKEQLDLEIEF